MNIYVASSWRNMLQQGVVHILRAAGHQVYDFKQPDPYDPGSDGFRWTEIDPNWQSWSPKRCVEALNHPIAVTGFHRDMNALRESDALVLVLPCGRSAHLEAGWAVAAGKKTCMVQIEACEPELMAKMFDRICTDFNQLLDWAGVKD